MSAADSTKGNGASKRMSNPQHKATRAASYKRGEERKAKMVREQKVREEANRQLVAQYGREFGTSGTQSVQARQIRRILMGKTRMTHNKAHYNAPTDAKPTPPINPLAELYNTLRVNSLYGKSGRQLGDAAYTNHLPCLHDDLGYMDTDSMSAEETFDKDAVREYMAGMGHTDSMSAEA